jgi:macrolide transport system ATP-binding/permease protein
MDDTVIQVIGLTRTYGIGDIDVRALQGVNLTVRRGEFIAIMGASGSGKSTLMAILGCLDRPTTGQYFFEGVDVSQLDEPALARIRSERLGFVFQNFNLLPRTSALENVELPLFYSEVASHNNAMRRNRARAVLARMGLANREYNTPGQLSGGQQQRVAIARALINDPALLLADEPTGNLDTKTSHEIMEALVKLNQEQGVTIVVVTHERDIASYANRIVTMRDGRIIADEPLRGHSESPALEATGPQLTQGNEAQVSGVAGAASWYFGLMVLSAAIQIWPRCKGYSNHPKHRQLPRT